MGLGPSLVTDFIYVSVIKEARRKKVNLSSYDTPLRCGVYHTQNTAQDLVFMIFFARISIYTKTKGKPMTLHGYTYQIGDLFTTSKTGVTGRIASFSPISNKVTRVSLILANGSQRLAMVKTSK